MIRDVSSSILFLITVAALLAAPTRSCTRTVGKSFLRQMRQIQRRFDPNAQKTFADIPEVVRINSEGQRFTATHGIKMKKGEVKEMVFVVDRDDVNYMAISSNIAVRDSEGGPERYEIYMRYGKPATMRRYDQKTTLTASESYVGSVLYSRDIVVTRPRPGNYFLLLVAKEDFHELLMTAIMDTPPDVAEQASFTIQRMGELL